MLTEHPILRQSFAHIDQQVGDHGLSAWQYAIARRVIHSTADFEFLRLLRFGSTESTPPVLAETVLTQALASLHQGTPIVTDVTMVKQGIQSMVNRTFGNPLLAAIDFAPVAALGQTRTETGMNLCLNQFPQAIYMVGNAPTALLAICRAIAKGVAQPALVVGVPVGFIGVLEAKQALAQTPCAQIRVAGNKGGSPVAAAIINALLTLAINAGDNKQKT